MRPRPIVLLYQDVLDNLLPADVAEAGATARRALRAACESRTDKFTGNISVEGVDGGKITLRVRGDAPSGEFRQAYDVLIDLPLGLSQHSIDEPLDALLTAALDCLASSGGNVANMAANLVLVIAWMKGWPAFDALRLCLVGTSDPLDRLAVSGPLESIRFYQLKEPKRLALCIPWYESELDNGVFTISTPANSMASAFNDFLEENQSLQDQVREASLLVAAETVFGVTDRYRRSGAGRDRLHLWNLSSALRSNSISHSLGRRVVVTANRDEAIEHTRLYREARGELYEAIDPAALPAPLSGNATVVDSGALATLDCAIWGLRSFTQQRIGDLSVAVSLGKDGGVLVLEAPKLAIACYSTIPVNEDQVFSQFCDPLRCCPLGAHDLGTGDACATVVAMMQALDFGRMIRRPELTSEQLAVATCVFASIVSRVCSFVVLKSKCSNWSGFKDGAFSKLISNALEASVRVASKVAAQSGLTKTPVDSGIGGVKIVVWRLGTWQLQEESIVRSDFSTLETATACQWSSSFGPGVGPRNRQTTSRN